MDLEKVDLIELINLLHSSTKNEIGIQTKEQVLDTIQIPDSINEFTIYELANEDSSKAPLRAIILDNDETTGSYTLVFAVISALATQLSLSHNYLAYIFKRLAFWMFKHNIFRPGIRMLLKKILDLKRNNYIDAVIMYTNQIDGSGVNFYTDYNTKYPDFLKSCAGTIAYMMECLMNEKIFDHILTRNPLEKPTKEGYYPKSFKRILDLYPDHPKDITNMVFIDDFACPQFINADDIEKKSEDSWYCIEPYIRQLKPVDIRDCVQYCFQDALVEEYMYMKILNYIQNFKASNKSRCESCDNDFIELCNFLDLKFLFPFYLWISSKDDDLNKKNSIVVYGQGEGQQREQSTQASKTDGGETQRKHDHFE